MTLTKAVDNRPDEGAITLAKNPPIANSTIDRIAADLIANANPQSGASEDVAEDEGIITAQSEAELQAWSEA